MRFRVSRALVATAIVATVAACSDGGSGGAASTGSTTTSRQQSAPTSTPSGRMQVTPAAWKLVAPVANEVAVSDGTTITILGGLDSTKFSTNAIVRLTPTSGASQPLGKLSQAVHDSAGVRVGNTTLLFGGGGPSENGSAAVQRVDAAGRTTVVGEMPQPRSDQVAAAIDGKIYVLGGYDGTNIVGDVITTTDGTSFTRVGVLPVPVRYPAVAVVGKAIYLFGGVASTKGSDTAAIQRLDTTTGKITVIGQLPTTVSHASAIVLGDVVYILGGYINNTQLSAQILRFNPAIVATTAAGQLPQPNSDAAAVTVNGRGYLLGGKSTARAPLDAVLTFSTQ